MDELIKLTQIKQAAEGAFLLFNCPNCDEEIITINPAFLYEEDSDETANREC